MNTNVDPVEIEKFANLASRWWDPESEFKPLHTINPLRLNYILEHSGGLQGKRVLDVGCGGGILSESLIDHGAVVTGIDMGEAQISVAKLHALESKKDIDYQRIPADELAKQEPGSYDVVACLEVLEHVPDPAAIVKACSDLVKPGGDVYFSTINRNPKAWLLAIVGAEYVLNMLPKGTHAYDKFIKPSEMDTWMRAADLTMQDIIGMHYNPLRDHYKLAPGVDVNYLLWSKKAKA
ncbi:MAG: bifunctional 2-polyprenyl-6-hydroxyphenol methylase/3-demethylubiquinol 3-O-methyltransferase UbiG [Gammaproteobacteria bacterium]|nr:bifunctional 2-polyprenyl-6-hydroxyphenol methylase/3-demethylubiquinol 3-O-methyltransferase UbiG [Gammaproteobacteria bacterium]NNJ73455.1 bifunctional 2-polyprenyl-6-hydroxyphenol methylase/3-demethylubiquinol 3-O-methyltransferase UbiG [Enterobacterales bacterium]